MTLGGEASTANWATGTKGLEPLSRGPLGVFLSYGATRRRQQPVTQSRPQQTSLCWDPDLSL